ncbi:MAG: hypothetical protein AB8H86_03550 [Polyangiales bacterium]
MRASQMKSGIRSLDTLAEAGTIRRECRSLIEPVEAALSVSWLPFELNSALVERVEEICGAEAAAGWAQESIRRSMSGTFLKPILDGLMRLGLGPKHAIRRCAAGWDLFYKNAGHLECSANDHEATLILSGAPRVILAPSYLRSIAATYGAIALELGAGDVKADFVVGRYVEFSVRWKPR